MFFFEVSETITKKENKNINLLIIRQKYIFMKKKFLV